MIEGLAAAGAEPKTVMIDLSEGAPHSFKPAGEKGDLGRLIGRTKGGMNTKLHAVADANGRPLSFFMTAGQVNDYTGAAALLDDMPNAQWLLGEHATSRSDTTSGAIGDEAASRSCSVASRTGAASQPDTTAALSPSFPPSPWLPPSSSGCDQRVLTLRLHLDCCIRAAMAFEVVSSAQSFGQWRSSRVANAA